MSTSLVYVLPSIMFGQMLAARKETQPQLQPTLTRALTRALTLALTPALILTGALNLTRTSHAWPSSSYWAAA